MQMPEYPEVYIPPMGYFYFKIRPNGELRYETGLASVMCEPCTSRKAHKKERRGPTPGVPDVATLMR